MLQVSSIGLLTLDQNCLTFIQPKMPRRYPTVGMAGCGRVGRIERRYETVLIRLGQFAFMNAVIERGQHNPGREWQRRRDGQWRERAIVGFVWHAASNVVEETALDPRHDKVVRAGTFARGQSPAVFAVVRKLERVADRVLALHVGRASTVLEIVDALGEHESVLDTAKVDPDMRELVCEKRPGIQIIKSVAVFQR